MITNFFRRSIELILEILIATAIGLLVIAVKGKINLESYQYALLFATAFLVPAELIRQFGGFKRLRQLLISKTYFKIFQYRRSSLEGFYLTKIITNNESSSGDYVYYYSTIKIIQKLNKKWSTALHINNTIFKVYPGKNHIIFEDVVDYEGIYHKSQNRIFFKGKDSVGYFTPVKLNMKTQALIGEITIKGVKYRLRGEKMNASNYNKLVRNASDYDEVIRKLEKNADNN